MLDSRMMPYYGEKWTEWNIRGAVRSWRRDSSRNYGISIEVEDDEGNLLPVVRFFKPLNCSGDASTSNYNFFFFQKMFDQPFRNRAFS